MQLEREKKQPIDSEAPPQASDNHASFEMVEDNPARLHCYKLHHVAARRSIPLEPGQSRDLLLDTSSNNYDQVELVTIPQMFTHACNTAPPNRIALNYKLSYEADAPILSMTYAAYLPFVRKIARCFIKCGLRALEPIQIMGFNHLAWFSGVLGAIFAGGIGCGMYTTNNADTCRHIISECNSSILIIENSVLLGRLVTMLKELGGVVRVIVQYTGEIQVEHRDILGDQVQFYTWDEFVALDEQNDAEKASLETELEKRVAAQNPNQCCLISFTSGTTGMPKGAMISHDNINYEISQIQHLVEGIKDKRSVSYLPMNHIAAVVLDVFMPPKYHGIVTIANPDALKGSLFTTIKETRPTLFFGVPRVYEKMMEGFRKFESKIPEGSLKHRLMSWSKGVLRDKIQHEFDTDEQGRLVGQPGLKYKLIQKLWLDKFKQETGLDQVYAFFAAGAPLLPAVTDYLAEFDLRLCDLYGMTEMTGGITSNHPSPRMYKKDSVGKVLKWSIGRIIRDEDGNDEICGFGRFVFMGYLNQPEATREALDEDGFLHSGDLGHLDDEQFLWITGRKKELIITAGGENIGPLAMENEIFTQLDFISNVIMIGDKQKYLTCLLTFKTCQNVAEATGKDEKLDQLAIESLSKLGLKDIQTIGEAHAICYQDPIKSEVDRAIAMANAIAASRASKIQKWRILPNDFSIDAGELTPTLKLKRKVINQKYASVIAEMYDEDGAEENTTDGKAAAPPSNANGK